MSVCKANGDLYQKLGNLAASSQHKNMTDQCQRDLLAIKGIRSQVSWGNGWGKGWGVVECMEIKYVCC